MGLPRLSNLQFFERRAAQPIFALPAFLRRLFDFAQLRASECGDCKQCVQIADGKVFKVCRSAAADDFSGVTDLDTECADDLGRFIPGAGAGSVDATTGKVKQDVAIVGHAQGATITFLDAKAERTATGKAEWGLDFNDPIAAGL